MEVNEGFCQCALCQMYRAYQNKTEVIYKKLVNVDYEAIERKILNCILDTNEKEKVQSWKDPNQSIIFYTILVLCASFL